MSRTPTTPAPPPPPVTDDPGWTSSTKEYKRSERQPSNTPYTTGGWGGSITIAELFEGYESGFDWGHGDDFTAVYFGNREGGRRNA